MCKMPFISVLGSAIKLLLEQLLERFDGYNVIGSNLDPLFTTQSSNNY